MKLFDLLSFLAENPSEENMSIVFPSANCNDIDPQLFWAAVMTRGSDFDINTWEFMQRFVEDLHKGAIGKFTASK